MYVCTYVLTYVRMCMCLCMCMCICICICICFLYVYMYMFFKCIYVYMYIMKLVASPQESQTAPKWLLDDLEPQGYEIGGPWPKWIDRPPGPNQYAHTDAIPFCHHCDPLVVLSLDVICIQVTTCESLHWKWLEKAHSSKIVL